MKQDIDWGEIRLALAKQGKTVAEIEKIVDRWYRHCLDGARMNDNENRSKPHGHD